MNPFMRSHTWNGHPLVSPAVQTVGELRVPLKGRPNKSRRPFWVLDYSFVSGTYYRLTPRGAWHPRMAGEAHLYAPNVSFWSKSDPSFHRVSQSLYVVFSADGDIGLQALFNPGEHYARFLDPRGTLGKRMRLLVETGIHHGEQGFWQAQSVLWRVFDLLSRHSLPSPDGSRTIALGSTDTDGWDFISRVDRYLRTHMTEPLTRNKIARVMGVSVSTLSHRYRNLTGMSPIQRLLCLRIEATKTLLRNGQPLKTAAVATGCYDASYLSKLFKSIVGMTPRQYMKLTGDASSVE